MRLLKSKGKFNWKYVLGEILLIFIGINLAIWFNNWNSSLKSAADKELAITKIKEEIESNLGELIYTDSINQTIVKAFDAYQEVYHDNSSQVIATPSQFHHLNSEYPNFFKASDSLALDSGLYLYNGTTYVMIELAEITDIAWETTQSISITHEFNYDCLFALESMYNLQHRVHKELDKAAEALQQRELKKLMSILNTLKQLDEQLIEDYRQVLDNIGECE